jgi:hypothetical protein
MYPRKLDLPISPELALVDPELASYARSLLPPIDLDAPTATDRHLVEEPRSAAPALPAGRRRTTRRRAGLMLAAALAISVPAALAVTRSGGHGPAGRKPAQQAAGGPRHTATPHASPTSTVTARVDGARKTVVSPVKKPTHRRAAPTTSVPATRRAQRPKRRVILKAPLLHWTSSPSARFFDVVLWRDGERVLDSWPSISRLRVPASWTYGGHHYRLGPGTYLWFVYPGVGSRLHPRYGPLLTSGRFTISSPGAD